MSSKSRRAHTRKVRRQQNAVIRWGWGAKPTHRLKTGRTGAVREKQLKGERFPVKAAKPQILESASGENN